MEKTMLDLKKRQTLKIFGAAPLISLPFVASAGDVDLSEPLAANLPSPPELPKVAAHSSMQLEIQIIDSSAVPDNNVVIRNTTDESLIITKFMPGHIVFGNKLMDLNAAVGGGSLKLRAGQSKALHFDVWSVLNAGPIEYVWADHAVEVLSDQTSIVTLGAFMSNTNAVVYANTQYVPA